MEEKTNPKKPSFLARLFNPSLLKSGETIGLSETLVGEYPVGCLRNLRLSLEDERYHKITEEGTLVVGKRRGIALIDENNQVVAFNPKESIPRDEGLVGVKRPNCYSPHAVSRGDKTYILYKDGRQNAGLAAEDIILEGFYLITVDKEKGTMETKHLDHFIITNNGLDIAVETINGEKTLVIMTNPKKRLDTITERLALDYCETC